MSDTKPSKLSALQARLASPATLAPTPILLPPVPARSRSRAADEQDPCASLMPEALQQLIDKVAESVAKAESDADANGTTGAYAAAAVYNRDNLAEVQRNLLFLQSWLTELELDAPFGTTVAASYGIYASVREDVYLLHHARFWAAISVVYHKSPDAFDSYSLTSEALGLAEALGEQAGRCYMSGYFP
jgi:hypothetical protein